MESKNMELKRKLTINEINFNWLTLYILDHIFLLILTNGNIFLRKKKGYIKDQSCSTI